MKTYINPVCEILLINQDFLLCASFDQVDSTELFYVDDPETI
jgi:hypothetical protein